MKRTVKLLVLILAITAMPLGAAEPVLTEVGPGIYAFIGGAGTTNSGVVVTKAGVVVIDTQGPKELALELKRSIARVTGTELAFVINTHYHGDHTFGNQYFNDGYAIIAQDNTRWALIEKDAAHRARFKGFFGPESLDGFILTPPEATFPSELTLSAGGRTFIITHPGIAHTKGDAYVYLPESKVVFTGDLAYKGRLPWLGDGDSGGAIEALDELLALDVEVYVPGHGPVADRADMLAYRGYLSDLRAEGAEVEGGRPQSGRDKRRDRSSRTATSSCTTSGYRLTPLRSIRSSTATEAPRRTDVPDAGWRRRPDLNSIILFSTAKN